MKSSPEQVKSPAEPIKSPAEPIKASPEPLKASARPHEAARAAPSPPACSSPEPSKSWASLFAGKGGPEGASEQTRPTAVISPYSSGPVVGSCSAPAPEQPTPQGDLALGTFLRHYSLKHASTALLPRGLTNRSNWCFVNAILQALLACPPLYNLMKSLGSDPFLQASLARAPAPMLSSLVKFMGEFSLLDPLVTARGMKKDKAKRRADLVTGIGLEPSCVFNMLLGLKGDNFRVLEGRQEDAEEFLTCLLNGLSDEMTEQIKLVEEQEEEEGEQEEGGDDWQEVGAKGRSCVTRRVQGTNLPQTPIQVRQSSILSQRQVYPLRPWPWACVAPV